VPSEDNSLDNLEALACEARDIEERLQELREKKAKLEDSYQSIEAREELVELAEVADDIAETKQFKDKFCDAYERTSSVVDLAELVATILFPANLPLVVGSLVALKLVRIGIDNYCAGR
jgi:predicted nuclease with TOPRIM domain